MTTIKPSSRAVAASAIAAIFGIALILRLWGIWFGLPYEYHVDEVQYVRQAAAMGARGLQPVWWNNPPFFKYLLFAEYAGLFLLGKVIGLYTSVSDFGQRNTLDPSVLYLLGRGTSAILGALTVLIVYWLGKAAYSRRAGLLGAAFLAVCFIHVRDSHFAVNDVAVTFLMTITLLASVQIVRTRAVRWYIVAGIALGLSFATKYSAIFAGIPVLLAVVLESRMGNFRPLRRVLGRLLLVVAMAACCAAIASPYFVLTPGKVIRDAYEALYLAGQGGFDGWQIDPAGGYLFYLKSLGWGLGWGLSVLALAGLARAAWQHTPADLVLLSLPIVMYIALGRQQMYFARFALPIVPPLLLLSAALLDAASRKWASGQGILKVGLVVVALLLMLQPLAATLRFDYLLAQTDTRTLAKEWIETQLPEGSKIAVDWAVHGPPLKTPERDMPASSRAYDVTAVGGAGLSDHDLAWYRQQGFDYLIASSFISNIPLADKTQGEQRQAFYAALDRDLSRIQEFRPAAEGRDVPFIFDEVYGPAISVWRRERPGPTLKIYRAP